MSSMMISQAMRARESGLMIGSTFIEGGSESALLQISKHFDQTPQQIVSK